jgi:hypothetical protein
VGDFDRDGKLDLAVADGEAAALSILLGSGDGTFRAAESYATGTYPEAVIVRDFNGDGKLDLATANQIGTISVLLGNGNGTFPPAANYTFGGSCFWAVAGDFNGDGILDLAATAGSAVAILLGNGNGAFQSPRIAQPIQRRDVLHVQEPLACLSDS